MGTVVKRNPKAPRQRPALLPNEIRVATCDEVCQGFTLEQAQAEALRCLTCKHPTCVEGCPLNIDIPRFIASVAEGNPSAAFQTITKNNPLPGICGRVCPQESFCEKACLLGRKREPVAIGLLERFVADHRPHLADARARDPSPPQGPRVALVGSGPSSLMAADVLARKGYRVSVFEELHALGGVLSSGIPPFRLPRDVLQEGLARLERLGVRFVTDFPVGSTATVDELFEAGYAAVFLGTGAGLPYRLNVPGEHLAGVYTAQEFLTRVNAICPNQSPSEAAPVSVGQRTLVVGGGNSAMDAARWALRFGSETAVLFRRGRAELPALAEEIELAEQEGVRFAFQATPVRFLGDDEGSVREAECIRMHLGAPDASGRPSPIRIPGSEYRIAVETVIVAIGQDPDPGLLRATPKLLTRKGRIVVDAFGKTSVPRVYAGGDVVRGSSTVVQAMRDGRVAAEAIDRDLRGLAP